MKTVGKLMLKGLIAVLPIALTLYLVWSLGSGMEALLGGLLRRVLPERLYLPGLGLILGAGLLIAMGSLMNGVVARRLAAALDGLMDRVPLVKTVYGSVRDLLSLFSKTAKDYTVLAPRSALTPVHMEVEHALRFAITGGGASENR